MVVKSFVAAVALAGAAMLSASACAMPFGKLSDTAGNIEQVRMVCGPYGCYWRPGFRPYRPRVYGGRTWLRLWTGLWLRLRPWLYCRARFWLRDWLRRLRLPWTPRVVRHRTLKVRRGTIFPRRTLCTTNKRRRLTHFNAIGSRCLLAH